MRACVCHFFVVPLQRILAFYAHFGTKMYQIFIVIVLLLLAVGLLCVGVIFRKDHSFRSQHIRDNRRMQKDGITCATSQDREARRTKKYKKDIK